MEHTILLAVGNHFLHVFLRVVALVDARKGGVQLRVILRFDPEPAVVRGVQVQHVHLVGCHSIHQVLHDGHREEPAPGVDHQTPPLVLGFLWGPTDSRG